MLQKTANWQIVVTCTLETSLIDLSASQALFPPSSFSMVHWIRTSPTVVTEPLSVGSEPPCKEPEPVVGSPTVGPSVD